MIIDAVELFEDIQDEVKELREFNKNQRRVCDELGVDSMEEAVDKFNTMVEAKGLNPDEVFLNLLNGVDMEEEDD